MSDQHEFRTGGEFVVFVVAIFLLLFGMGILEAIYESHGLLGAGLAVVGGFVIGIPALILLTVKKKR